jgi:hypothetical protein
MPQACPQTFSKAACLHTTLNILVTSFISLFFAKVFIVFSTSTYNAKESPHTNLEWQNKTFHRVKLFFLFFFYKKFLSNIKGSKFLSESDL